MSTELHIDADWLLTDHLRLCEVLHDAARNGVFERFKSTLLFLEEEARRCGKDLRPILSSERDGAAVLLVACRYNQESIVRFLLEEFINYVNVEQAGRVPSFRQGKEVRGASPLWVAASGGYLSVVRMLLDAGADVNHSTSTKSTPARGASFHGHLEVVRCLAEHGADLDARNMDGQSPLLVACAMGRLAVVEYLVGLGVRWGRDVSGLDEMFMAAVYGHDKVLEHLVNVDSVSESQKADAFELLGATRIDSDDSYFDAHFLWRKAMYIRDDAGLSHLTYEQRKEYAFVCAPCSVQELQAMDAEAMNMYALMIRERVIGKYHPFTAHFIRYRAAVYCDEGHFARCEELLRHALTLQCHTHDEPYSNVDVHDDVLSYAELLNDMIEADYRPGVRSFFSWVLEDVEQCIQQKICYTKMIMPLLSMLGLWLRLGDLTEEEEIDRWQFIHRLVSMNLVDSYTGWTLLHFAVDSSTTAQTDFPPHNFPSPPVVRCLLQCGASPNVKDLSGRTPLHLIASDASRVTTEQHLPMVHDLVRAGAHVHARDNNQRTPVDAIHLLLPSDLWREVQVPSLCSLSSCVVVDNKLFDKVFLPQKLRDFVLLH